MPRGLAPAPRAFPAPARARTLPRLARFPLVFIVGVGHSGSNLLSRLLARHPRVACVGETAWADYAAAKAVPCTCGRAYADCPYWGPLLPLLEGRRGYDHRRLTPQVFDELRRAAGADVLVDNSKTRVWRLARRWPGVGFLLLLRDSRGVLASGLRKDGADLSHLLRRHRKWIRRFARLARRRPADTLVLRYEDLATRPEAELRRVTDFLGIDFDPALLRPSSRPYHFMYCKKTAADRGDELRLDERWRDELPPADAARIAGAMHRVRLYRELYPSA